MEIGRRSLKLPSLERVRIVWQLIYDHFIASDNRFMTILWHPETLLLSSMNVGSVVNGIKLGGIFHKMIFDRLELTDNLGEFNYLLIRFTNHKFIEDSQFHRRGGGECYLKESVPHHQLKYLRIRKGLNFQQPGIFSVLVLVHSPWTIVIEMSVWVAWFLVWDRISPSVDQHFSYPSGRFHSYLLPEFGSFWNGIVERPFCFVLSCVVQPVRD